MTLPPVVSDPEGPCPERPGREWTTHPPMPHDWGFPPDVVTRLGALFEVCRFCGGRKPNDLG